MADLGVSPLANSFLRADDLDHPEPFYPLKVFVCSRCYLAQLGVYESPEQIFADYAYFSSISQTWLEHCAAFAHSMIERLALNDQSLVMEIGSNDGYLLQFFRDEGIPVLGVEPAANVAKVAIEMGIPTQVAFFGSELGRGRAGERRADLLIGNNVLAHVPDLNDFVEGLSLALAPQGLLSVEFPHLLRLIEDRQFDTIYHEHFSYFSLHAVRRVFLMHGMRVVDVEEIPTHGGSLRVYAVHQEHDMRENARVSSLIDLESSAGLTKVATFLEFAETVKREKRTIVRTLMDQKEAGNSIAGYGAPAKATTLLNYCGLGTDLLDFTVDLSPHKQGLFLPGSHVPILKPEALQKYRPDLVMILPWNLRNEIMQQLSYVRGWGGRLMARTPNLTVFP